MWYRTGLLVSLLAATSAQADDWPQWFGPKRDGVWREQGIVDVLPKDGPKVRWRVKIGAGYAGPAVVGNRVYVTDRVLDEGQENPDNAFKKTRVKGKERVLCLNDADGSVVWKHEYECTYEVSYASGPRTTPIIHEGKVYTLGTMGDLLCLDAAKGTVVWSKNFPKDYEARVPIWGFSSNPLLEGNKVICMVGGSGSVVVAFDKDTGKEIWKSLSAKEPGYCPPVIFEAGGKRQLIVWHPEALCSLDPENGKPYWSEKFMAKSGMTIATPRLQGNRLFVSCFFNGSMMVELDKDKPTAKMLWKIGGRSEKPDQSEGLHACMATPILTDGHIYGICGYGELRCLKEDTGERVWDSLKVIGGELERWGNAFLTPHEDRFFLFNEKGDLIIAKLSPKGYEELSRANLLKPDNRMCGRPVVWSHPAYAHKNLYARNDQEIVSVSLAKE